MALHRTVVPLVVAATLIVAAGCDNLSSRRLDFDNTESARIGTVRVLPGSGDVTVRGTGTDGQVRIKRTVRYHGSEPDVSYEIRGTELVLETDCGEGCGVSYDVTLPAAASVTGETGSGDIDLSKVGPVEVRVGSGNIRVSGATTVKAETGSGDVRVDGATGAVRIETGSGNVEVEETGAATLRTGSGDITGRRLAAGADAEAGSGNVTIDLAAPASVRAHADSGDVKLVVPAARYQVRTRDGGGEVTSGVAHDPAAVFVLDVSSDGGNQTISQR